MENQKPNIEVNIVYPTIIDGKLSFIVKQLDIDELKDEEEETEETTKEN